MIDTAAIFCGGLGTNQFRIAPSAATQCPPNVLVRYADDTLPFGYDVGIVPPIVEIIQKTKAENPGIVRVVGAFHSMGWAVFLKASLAGLLDSAIVLDAVGTIGVSHDNWPRVDVKKDGYFFRQPGLLYRAATRPPGVTGLWVADGPTIIDRPCGHNELCHDPEVIAAILREVSP